MTANIDNATTTMPLTVWEEIKRKGEERQQRIDQLEAQLRETRYTTASEVKKIVNGMLGARMVVGYAISRLSPYEQRGWPVTALRQYVEGLRVIDSPDPDVKDSVRDFAHFADEADQVEVVRQAQDAGRAGDAASSDDADATVARLLGEAEALGGVPAASTSFETQTRATTAPKITGSDQP